MSTSRSCIETDRDSGAVIDRAAYEKWCKQCQNLFDAVWCNDNGDTAIAQLHTLYVCERLGGNIVRLQCPLCIVQMQFIEIEGPQSLVMHLRHYHKINTRSGCVSIIELAQQNGVRMAA